MKRITLRLERELVAELEKLAKAEKLAVAGAARRLLHEALAYRKQLALQRTMVAAYSAGETSEELDTLRSLQGGQDDLLETRRRPREPAPR